MKINIEISEDNLQNTAVLLNTLLADEYLLYTKTRNAHWNVEGVGFMALHKFFEGQYEALDVIVDDVAERVRSLGHFAIGTLGDFISMTRLSEHNEDFSDQNHMIQTLVDDHEEIIRFLRKDIPLSSDKHRDLGTADFMTGIMEQHEKMAWMLRAHLPQTVTTELAGTSEHLASVPHNGNAKARTMAPRRMRAGISAKRK